MRKIINRPENFVDETMEGIIAAYGDRVSNRVRACVLLTLAGLITPVKHTNGTGVPLGAEESNSYVKYLFFDLGVMLTMLDIPAADILTAKECIP